MAVSYVVTRGATRSVRVRRTPCSSRKRSVISAASTESGRGPVRTCNGPTGFSPGTGWGDGWPTRCRPPTPTSQPGDPAGARYGLDAGRVPIWASTGCSPAWRAVAASTRSLLDADPSIVGRTLTLSGEPISTGPDPTLTVAGAAAWSAAGATRQRDRLLDRAERLDRGRPTYYGGAWGALGPWVLTHSPRRGCG